MSESEIDWNVSLRKTWLPSRAFLGSWLEQTLPARRAAIDDATEIFTERSGAGESRLADMALLGVVGEAMQGLEDLAYLATAWDRPLEGIANYVIATRWERFTANNFWQEVPKWDDARLEVFAGFAARDRRSGQILRLTEEPESPLSSVAEHRETLELVAERTVAKLRRILTGLSRDWLQLSPYFNAYKHGGLAINRDDVYFIDEVEEPADTTKHQHPSIAVWTRGGRKQELQADFNLSAEDVVDLAAGAGRLTLEAVEVFVKSRLYVFESLDVCDDGTLRGHNPMQIPWTGWLREEDLAPEVWAKIGLGPRLIPSRAESEDFREDDSDA